MTKRRKPTSRMAAPMTVRILMPPICARRGAKLSEAAVARRAMASCVPMADASSYPVNHLVMILEMVMPVMSHPMPKMPKPREAISTCVLMGEGINPKKVKGRSTVLVGVR